METRNGWMRATTTSTATSGSDESTLTTHGVTIAYSFPTPRGAEAAWRCAGHPDPEVFHPTDDATLAEATAICAGCPSQARCLELGVQRGEFGVWGGVLLEAGKRGQVRKMGRPSKAISQRDGGEQAA